MDALTKAFLEWANRKGYDTAHAYNQNESRWMFLSPMTADVYEAWQAARTVPEWISVTDRLPEQDVSFLAVTDCAGDIYISTMRLPVLISKNSKPDGDFIRERVTHWMPLPAAPEPKK